MIKFKQVLILLGFTAIFLSCRNKDSNIYSETPSKRIQGKIDELRQELVNTQDGWLLSYFPAIDSLKFSSPTKNIKTDDNAIVQLHTKFGEGGYNFYMKFNPKGTVEMLSDKDYNTVRATHISDFEVDQNTYTQLSFTTYNYIHQLLKSDFLFWKKDENGRLIFRTNQYLDKNKEYIVMTPLKLNNETISEKIYNIYYQRLLFERANNPILTIRDSDNNILFQSNFAFRQITKEKRYTVFVKNWQPKLYNSSYYSGLGSGYTSTESGLFFYPGIRLSDKVVFRTFNRDGSVYRATVDGYTAEIDTN